MEFSLLPEGWWSCQQKLRAEDRDRDRGQQSLSGLGCLWPPPLGPQQWTCMGSVTYRTSGRGAAGLQGAFVGTRKVAAGGAGRLCSVHLGHRGTDGVIAPWQVGHGRMGAMQSELRADRHAGSLGALHSEAAQQCHSLRALQALQRRPARGPPGLQP